MRSHSHRQLALSKKPLGGWPPGSSHTCVLACARALPENTSMSQSEVHIPGERFSTGYVSYRRRGVAPGRAAEAEDPISGLNCNCAAGPLVGAQRWTARLPWTEKRADRASREGTGSRWTSKFKPCVGHGARDVLAARPARDLMRSTTVVVALCAVIGICGRRTISRP
jgi:hypothetical protein